MFTGRTIFGQEDHSIYYPLSIIFYLAILSSGSSDAARQTLSPQPLQPLQAAVTDPQKFSLPCSFTPFFIFACFLSAFVKILSLQWPEGLCSISNWRFQLPWPYTSENKKTRPVQWSTDFSFAKKRTFVWRPGFRFEPGKYLPICLFIANPLTIDHESIIGKPARICQGKKREKILKTGKYF
jgi:hypothetical protein